MWVKFINLIVLPQVLVLACTGLCYKCFSVPSARQFPWLVLLIGPQMYSQTARAWSRKSCHVTYETLSVSLSLSLHLYIWCGKYEIKTLDLYHMQKVFYKGSKNLDFSVIFKHMLVLFVFWKHAVDLMRGYLISGPYLCVGQDLKSDLTI